MNGLFSNNEFVGNIISDGIEDSEEDEDEDKDEDEGPTLTPIKRASRNSKGRCEPRPTTLQYYDGLVGWPNVLIHAKQRFAMYISVINAFPKRETHLKDAETILARAVIDFQDQGGDIDNGQKIHHAHIKYQCSLKFLLAYEQTRDMNILVRKYFRLILPCLSDINLGISRGVNLLWYTEDDGP